MVMCLRPVAVQAGQTTECEVVARYNLYGAYKVFVSGDGVSARVDVPKPPLKPGAPKPQLDTLKVRFQVLTSSAAAAREELVARSSGWCRTFGRRVESAERRWWSCQFPAVQKCGTPT